MTSAPRAALPAPYIGLRPFEFREAPLFYGRGEHIAEMVRTLRQRHFLAVIGSSGSGKSSLVRAGLLPAIASGVMSAGEEGLDWRFVIMRPGLDPYENLLEALLPKLTPEETPDPDVVECQRETLRAGPRGLLEAIADALLPENARIVVLVDQFEEIFRFLERGRAESIGDPLATTDRRNAALAFVDMLLGSAAKCHPSLFLILTMRSEYIGECEAFMDLSAAISSAQFLTPRMTRDQVRDVIERPLAGFGGRVEPSVVTSLLNSLGTVQDQLPRVQHALLRMWDRAEAKQEPEAIFTPEDYASVGRFEEALDQHGEQLFWALGTRADDGIVTEQQRVAERMFRSLAVRTAQGTLVRRLSSLGEVANIAGASESVVCEVVEHFRQPGCNFIVASPEQPLNGETRLDISHESLLRQWKRMSVWAEEESQAARRYRRLAETAQLEADGKAGLWTDPELQLMLDWEKEQSPNSAWANLYGGNFEGAFAFLKKSQLARDTHRAENLLHRKWNSSWRLLLYVLCAALAYTIFHSSTVTRIRQQNLEDASQEKLTHEKVLQEEKIVAQDVREALEPSKLAAGEAAQAFQSEPVRSAGASLRRSFNEAEPLFLVLAPALVLFFGADFAGRKLYRRLTFPALLSEVERSSDRAVREDRLKRELERQNVTDPAAAKNTTYATFWRRLGAGMLDFSFLGFGVGLLITVIVQSPWLYDLYSDWLLSLSPLFLGWSASVFFLCSHRQATPGMRAMGLIVTNQHAERLRFGQATLRYFARVLSVLTLGIGFLIQPWMKHRRALHDLISRTVVLTSPDQGKVRWYVRIYLCLIFLPITFSLIFIGVVIAGVLHGLTN